MTRSDFTSMIVLLTATSSIFGRENEDSLISLTVPIRPLFCPPIRTTRLFVVNSIIFSSFLDGNSILNVDPTGTLVEELILSVRPS